MPSGNCRLHSVNARHSDDRSRNAPDVFRNGIHTFFIISDLYRSLPISHADYRSPLDPFNVNVIILKLALQRSMPIELYCSFHISLSKAFLR